MSESGGKTSEFINSRLGVTIIAFILTAIVGGFLTYFWHTKEYVYKAKLEREYSKIKAHSEARKNLYNKIFDQTSKFIVAVDRVISIYEHSISNPEQQRQIIENFNSVSNEWQKESVIVRSQLRLLFFEKTSPEVIIELENEWTELLNESESLYGHVADLVTKYKIQHKSIELTKKYKECEKFSLQFIEKVYTFGNNLISTIFSE